MPGVGWIMTVVIGGFAGWIASRLMGTSQGLLTNIIVGILGAVVANGILELVLNRTWGGWIGQLVVGVGGACLLLWVWRQIRARR